MLQSSLSGPGGPTTAWSRSPRPVARPGTREAGPGGGADGGRDQLSVRQGGRCRRADSRGFDGGKFINGRKRHVVVDTLGLLVGVMVTAADVGDRTAAQSPQARCQGGQGAVRREGDGEAGEGEANRRAFGRPAGQQIWNLSLDRAAGPGVAIGIGSQDPAALHADWCRSPRRTRQTGARVGPAGAVSPGGGAPVAAPPRRLRPLRLAGRSPARDGHPAGNTLRHDGVARRRPHVTVDVQNHPGGRTSARVRPASLRHFRQIG